MPPDEPTPEPAPDDLSPLERLTTEARDALLKIPGVELIEVEPGRQLATELPADYDAFGLKRMINLDTARQSVLGVGGDVTLVVQKLMAELANRNVRPVHTQPMWFASLEDFGYSPFKLQGFTFTLTAEMNAEYGIIGIFIAVDADRL